MGNVLRNNRLDQIRAGVLIQFKLGTFNMLGCTKCDTGTENYEQQVAYMHRSMGFCDKQQQDVCRSF